MILLKELIFDLESTEKMLTARDIKKFNILYNAQNKGFFINTAETKIS